ncbi:Exodeoxyribonuclease VII small subunit [Peptoniphilus asaccharolyticus DSM 20463]|uniref:Exodeoxyribonuclease 7 small subunit n=1 Tax=Peptoniphilus asaccharolyticus DSM 20463 TaxID=573058 RepID=A0A1W1UMS5_PEPAS|nr:exodeoxyribonuclease VII small subunit [Peptoniphilus asaccharolyticus]MBL7574940.1 exodeoxyribonuclease VII small subunit [Peptoniphilus asaccharolyticus]SMB82438.1 Exodeoxyribonuclease VII small subunit [Peptoniphilus asaccharolyticus DSM 20463]
MNETYESAFQKLQTIISELESREITLEDSIDKYEEGLRLYKFCLSKLDEYEGRIKVLMQENDTIVEKDFERQ